MTGNNTWPPSEIRQRPIRACRGTKAERDYKGGALISFSKFLY
jgi:hypothetical protein